MDTDALLALSPLPTATGRMWNALWQHQLGLLPESTGEGIFGVDLEGDCVFINRAGAALLGFEPAEVLGETCTS